MYFQTPGLSSLTESWERPWPRFAPWCTRSVCVVVDSLRRRPLFMSIMASPATDSSDCLLNSLLKLTSNKASALHPSAPCERNPPMTGKYFFHHFARARPRIQLC